MSEESSRVKLNLRVDNDVRSAFNDEIISKFGKLRPYAGIELEREFKYFLNKGEFENLKEIVDDLADTFDCSKGKEKIRETSREKTTPACHRIAEDVRRELMSAAVDDYRTAGELVEAIMYDYVREGSVVERLTQKLREVSEQSQREVDSSNGAKERRTKAIAQELAKSDRDGFTLEEFDEAVGAAQGIGASDYTQEQYLGRVLDELGFTWHPRNPDLFIDRELFELPEVRDPTKKPLILMDQDDRKLAIKLASYRETKENARGVAVFSITDAIDLFGGQVRKKTVRPLMRKIADNSPGYRYDPEKEVLKISQSGVKRHTGENQNIMSIEGEEESPKIGN